MRPFFADALPLLDAALNELDEGQLVKSLPLLEVMGAVQIGDARTDSFLSGAETKGSDVDFDPEKELGVEELAWIWDELFKLFTSFLDGHMFASTLLRCNYLRPAILSKLAPEFELVEGDMRMRVLRPLLLVTLKAAEIVWDECCKGHVRDNEDVHLSLATFNFPDLLNALLPPSLHGKEEPAVDDVLNELNDAVEWLQFAFPREASEALVGRLMLSFHFLYLLALLSSAAPGYPAIENLLSCSQWLDSIAPSSFEPPALSQAIFRPASARAKGKLPAVQPVRDAPACTWEEATEGFRAMLAELMSTATLREAGNAGGGWWNLSVYCSELGRRQPSPYVRSHFASTLNSFPHGVIAEDFLCCLTPLSKEAFAFARELRTKETAWNGPARRSLGWIERLGVLLSDALRLHTVNAPRARRDIVNVVGRMEGLVNDLLSLAPAWKEALGAFATVEHVTLALAVQRSLLVAQGLLAGFALQLYAPDEVDSILWAVKEVARATGKQIASMSGFNGSPDLVRHCHLLSGIAGASQVWRNALTLIPTRPAVKSPFTVLADSTVLERDRFRLRLGWASAPTLPLSFDEFKANDPAGEGNQELPLGVDASLGNARQLCLLGRVMGGHFPDEKLIDPWRNHASWLGRIAAQSARVDAVVKEDLAAVYARLDAFWK